MLPYDTLCICARFIFRTGVVFAHFSCFFYSFFRTGTIYFIMPRYPLEPKFTYSQGQVSFSLPKTSDKGYNGNIYGSDLLNATDSTNPIATPVYTLPGRGNNHSQRHGNRITITSIRTKLNFVLSPPFCANTENYNPFYSPLREYYTYYGGYPCKRFFKFRYFVVQFDDDLEVTKKVLSEWFYSTYCLFKEPTEQHAQANQYPISTHSNVLRITTPYTAKFNILCDKSFTLVSNRPSVSFDITLPLNKSFIFEEDTDNLIHPNIWQFIVPCLNWFVDVDPLTSTQYAQDPRSSSYVFCDMYYWTKLNFIDL